MKISTLIELLRPYQDCELLVSYYDTGTGEDSSHYVAGVSLEMDEEGTVVKVVIRA